MIKSIEKILVDIVKTCLNIPDSYGTTTKGDVIPSVIIYAQNIKLFNTDKLQVVIRCISSTPYSNRSEFVTNQDGTYSEIQDLNLQKMMQIDCYSRNNDARDRFWEITAALNSTYAQQQMDLYNFKIGRITQTNNISGIDGGSDINRYSITFNVLTHEQKITNIDYYDKFRLTAQDEAGQFANISST
ncbi:MAG: hypothetical protein II244_07850 [Clostridia bacterium]|nr:hypothetical protein [Clostridia bacterium]